MATSTIELTYSTIFARSLLFSFVENAPRFARPLVTHGLIIETAIRKYASKCLPGKVRVKTCDVYRCACIGIAHDEERMDVSGLIINKAELVQKLSRAQDDERDFDTNLNG